MANGTQSHEVMKIKIKELRALIREEFLHGVPEFAIQEATRRYVDEVRLLVKRYIETAKPSNFEQQREIYAAANELLLEFETEANDLLRDRLYAFTRRI